MKNNFEVKVQSAKELLEKLMDPEITLEESVNVYKQGKKELHDASKLLEEAKLTFTKMEGDTPSS